MNTATATAATFRYYGITDDTTTCNHCGREDLKRVVILMTLDADGNDEGLVYYGTTCAARALSARYGIRTTAAKIINEATNAEILRRRARAYAIEFLDHYGVALTGEVSREVLVQFRANNVNLRGEYPSFTWSAEFFAAKQAEAVA